MQMNEYQNISVRTLSVSGNLEKDLMIMSLGLAGESGEFCDEIKKHIGHGHNYNPDKEKKELGDILWYISAICSIRGYDLSNIAELNIKKLLERYPDGFSSERSINRKEVNDVPENY